MRTIAILLLAACGSDADSTADAQPTYDCDMLSMQVTQDKTSCTISHAGLTVPFGCAFIQWAYCGTNCPQGWPLSCDANDTNCTYDGTCSGSGTEFGTYSASQIYEGRRGLAVEIAVGRCEFRACE